MPAVKQSRTHGVRRGGGGFQLATLTNNERLEQHAKGLLGMVHVRKHNPPVM
jgi:hypothetical protein